MAVEKIFEVAIRKVSDFPEAVQSQINDQVSKNRSMYRRYSGFAKVIYVKSSPMSIHKIEPINGTVREYFETYKKEKSIDFNVF